MSKKPAKNPRSRRIAPQPVPMHATARRFDGGAVLIELVIAQPEDAGRLSDQLVNALVRGSRRR